MTTVKRPKSDCYRRSLPLQMQWKAKSTTLPNDARMPGTSWIDKGRHRLETGPFPVCLPSEHAALNLVPSVRSEALALFARNQIGWHMATPSAGGHALPSTHLLDSQVQCVNVLLSLAHSGRLLELVRRVEPGAKQLIPVDAGSPVTFEWNGLRDYLGEWAGKSQERPRGSMSTNADALVLVERVDGGRTAILVEWKFTENYPDPIPFKRSRNGRDRRETYRPHYEGDASPFAIRPDIDAFFHEPHYQLLRQALLGAAMVQHREFDIDRAVLLHLVPAGNRTLRGTVPDGLVGLGRQIDEVWKKLLPGPVVRYACLPTEPLFQLTPELAERYGTLGSSSELD